VAPTVAIRQCYKYEADELLKDIEWLYTESEGPDPSGKRILLKPNITTDISPERHATTHPAVVEAVIKYLQSRGATLLVGDSPAIETEKFTGEISGIRQVVEKCGASWVKFNRSTINKKIGESFVKITALTEEADLIISLPKMKNHELFYFSGAMKNIFGLVPGFNKMVQHAKFPDRYGLAEFFVDLEEAVKPHFHIMDAIVAMQGPGPVNGYPKRVNLLLASINPLALDIVASSIIGYDPVKIPINKIGLKRGVLMSDIEDIQVKGPVIKDIFVSDFKRITTGSAVGILLNYMKEKLPAMKKLDKKPVFDKNLCICCDNCINICSSQALSRDTNIASKISLSDELCIRCFCCFEACI
jgi:uncharacterized protein (DUF362 family)